MALRKYHLLLMCGVVALIAAGLFLALPSGHASAQCGSQASSCKNCHEVQGQKSVNSDGTGWHQSHAFGDFCYICHAGNNQSMDKATAHTGMVAPLSDIKASCQSCHPNDLTARAQVYASALGVSLEGGAGASSSGGATSSTTGQEATPTVEPAVSSGGETKPVVVEQAAPVAAETKEVVDYNARYDAMALEKRPVNWGNVTLIVLIVMLVLGGGAFVIYNERKRQGLPFVKQAAVVHPDSGQVPVIEGYSAEVTALLPKIAQLNPIGLHALKRLLDNPDSANELFHNLSRLDPELVNRVRTLDRNARELLLAMSGK